MVDFIRELKENPVYIKEQIIRDRNTPVLLSVEIDEDNNTEENIIEKPSEQLSIKLLKKFSRKEKSSVPGKEKHKLSLPYWIGYPGIMSVFLFIFLVALNKFPLALRRIPSINGPNNYEWIFYILCAIQILYFYFRAVNSGAYAIVKEKEDKTLEPLKTAPLSPHKIVEGKFWAIFHNLIYELTAGLPLFLYIGYLIKAHFLGLIIVYLFTVAQIAFALIIGLWASGKARNTRMAFTIANSLGIFMVISPVILGIITGLFFHRLIDKILPFILLTNPLTQSCITLESFKIEQIVEELLLRNCLYTIILLAVIYIKFPLLLWKNTIKSLEWSGSESLSQKTSPKIPEKKNLPAKTEKKISLFDILTNINHNPLYIKDKIIRERSRQWSFLTGYFFTLLIPLLTSTVIYCYQIYSLNHNYNHICYGRSYSEIDFFKPWYIVFIVACYIQVIYFYFKGNSSSSYLLLKEKRMKTFESIISTPMSAREIFEGKFWGAFYPPAYELTIMFPLFFISGIVGGVSFVKLIAIYLFTLWQLTFITAINLNFSTAALVNKDISYLKYMFEIFITEEKANNIITYYSKLFELQKTDNITKYIGRFFSILRMVIFCFLPVTLIFGFLVTVAIINPFFHMTVILFFENIFSISNPNLLLILGALLLSFVTYFIFTHKSWEYTMENLTYVPEE